MTLVCCTVCESKIVMAVVNNDSLGSVKPWTTLAILTPPLGSVALKRLYLYNILYHRTRMCTTETATFT